MIPLTLVMGQRWRGMVKQWQRLEINTAHGIGRELMRVPLKIKMKRMRFERCIGEDQL